MKTTNELRFVERHRFVRHRRNDDEWATDLILQQKWEGITYDDADHKKLYGTYKEEWRDVPLEKEPKT